MLTDINEERWCFTSNRSNTSVIRVKTSWCKGHFATGVTARTDTKNASNCVWRHWRRTNQKVAVKTKGRSGPSGLDAVGWRRIIVSLCFGTATSDLRKAIAELVKRLYVTNISNSNNCASLESLVTCRLIPLNKNPGLKLIRVSY